MKLTDKLVPILRKDEFDDVAMQLLKKHCPQCLQTPMSVPIEEIARQSMGLQLRWVNLSEDLSILGQIIFSSGLVELYNKDEDEYVWEMVEKGTVLIDPDVAVIRNIGSERNTIAHECVHWSIHRAYHTVQILAGGQKSVAFRCPVEPPIERNNAKWADEDWMEWQANGIAPKILMPKTMFVSFVEAHSLFPKMNKRGPELMSIWVDSLVGDLADIFQVSKQSAFIRLSELGFI